MLYRDVAELIATTRTVDEDGYEKPAETRKEVFVDVRSVKRSEFYASLQAGQELAAVFRLRACDYEGQERIEYGGKQYRVVRAYSEDGELLELNCAEYKGARP